jgi:hypothetical protein
VLATILAVALRLAPDELAIAWEAPASCPDAAYLRARIVEQLRGVEVEATKVEARVSAPAAPGAPWHLWIAIGDEGRRELEGESCTALADAAAVMVAISLNAAVEADDLGIPEPPPAEAPAVPTEPGPSTDAVAVDPSPEPFATPPEDDGTPAPVARTLTPEPPAGPRWQPPRAVLGISPGVHAVGLPAPGAQLGGRVGVRWGPLSAALSGTHFFRRERSVIDEVAASYQLTTGGLELCGVLVLGRGLAAFESFACAEAEAGRLRAEGLRAASPQVQRHPWVGVGGAAGAVWLARPWLALGLRADVVAPLLGRRFVVGDVSAGEVGPVDVRGALVLEVRVPAIVVAR